MQRFIVFERVQGSECWTIAYQGERTVNGIVLGKLPAQFGALQAAEEWVEQVHSGRMGWWGGEAEARPMESHIARVELP